MKVGSLFSGGGLGDFGLELAGMEIVWQAEIDNYCQKILSLRWPDVPKWKDIKQIDPKDLPTVDLISGGFPCQPFSVAGKRQGEADDRNLWPEMFRIISAKRPSWVFAENVPGSLRYIFDQVLPDLESVGYSTLPAMVIPACTVDAPHRRDRVWIVAYSKSNGLYSIRSYDNGEKGNGLKKAKWSNDRICFELGQKGIALPNGKWSNPPEFSGMVDGGYNFVDRLKLLGNGQVVPLVAWIGEKIMRFDKSITGSP